MWRFFYAIYLVLALVNLKITIMKLEKARAVYLSLREQYLSDRPMTSGEENTMWKAWHRLAELGWRWARIKDEQLRGNR